MASPDLIIGLGHKKRVGKDTFAGFLEDELERRGYNVVRCSFAHAMKKSANDIFFPLGLCPPEYYEQHGAEKDLRLTADDRTARQIWIEFGNAMRNIHPEIWVKHLEEMIAGLEQTFTAITSVMTPRPRAYLITDVRYPNEVAAIKSWGGTLIKINRPDAPVSDDVADCALDGYDGWDWMIQNDADLDWLKRSAGFFTTCVVNTSSEKPWIG